MPKNFIPQKALGAKPAVLSFKRDSSHHDRFFRRFYSDPKLALEIIRLIFPEKHLREHYDLSKLKLEKSVFKGLRMDLVLSLPLKNTSQKIKIVVLLEHKSQYTKVLFKQVLKYQTWLYEQSKQTIAVIPVLFYHGKKDYKWPLSFQKSVFGEDLSQIPVFVRKFMLDYRLKLLSTRSPQFKKVFKSREFKTGRVLQLLDRIWWLKDNERELKRILFAFFKDFSSDDNKILAVANYLNSVGIKRKVWERLEKEAVKKSLLKKGGHMDIKQEIREEGRQEGWRKGLRKGYQEGQEEGLQKGLQKVILNMIKEKAKLSFISKMTGMPVKEIRKLKNGS